MVRSSHRGRSRDSDGRWRLMVVEGEARYVAAGAFGGSLAGCMMSPPHEH